MPRFLLCSAEYPPAIAAGNRKCGQVDGTEWIVPAMTITDEPRFGYRGLMVDVARFFVPKENLLRIIDCMGMLKLNTLHLHLVDDNGWRIEIKKYPLLTEIGASRVERPGKLSPNAVTSVRVNRQWKRASILRMIFVRLLLMRLHAG